MSRKNEIVRNPPSRDQLNIMLDLAKRLVGTGFLPRSIRNGHQALAVILAGRDFGLSAMQSFRALNIVEGKIECSADFMHARVRELGLGHIESVRSDSQICVLVAVYPDGRKSSEVSFSLEDAKRAGLIGKHNWRHYPQDMLFARATSRLVRRCFPDALFGCYAEGEITDAVWSEHQPELAPPGSNGRLARCEATARELGLGDDEIKSLVEQHKGDAKALEEVLAGLARRRAETERSR